MPAVTAKVVVTHWVEEEVIEVLRPHARVEANRTRDTWPREVLLEQCRDADAVMVFMPDRVDEEFLAACPALRIVGGALKGCDNIDVEACTRRGIWVTIVPDLLTTPTAELALGLLLALTRNIVVGDRAMRQGGFQGWQPRLYGLALEGTTVGILGFGAVGQMVARRLGGFDLRIQYTDPAVASPPPALGDARAVGLPELMATSDHVILCAPLNPGSLHLLDARTLQQLKPGATVVNVGRGSVVDEEAVAAALQGGRLAGYAADVYELEDRSRPDRPQGVAGGILTAEGRTVLTPHLGSAVATSRQAIAHAATACMVAVLSDRAPAHAVNDPTRAASDSSSST